MGAVDYVPVPVIPEVFRAKVKVFVELSGSPANSRSSIASSKRASRNERPASKPPPGRSCRPSGSAASLSPPARWAVGLEHRPPKHLMDQGQCGIFGVEPSTFVSRFQRAALVHRGRPRAWRAPSAIFRKTPRPFIPNSGSSVKTARFALARHGDRELDEQERLSGSAAWSRHHRAQAGGRTPDLARRGGRPSRPQCRRRRSGDHAAYPRRQDRRLYRGDRGPRRRVISAHSLLSRSRWEGADLNRLVDGEVPAPYRAGGKERVLGERTCCRASACDRPDDRACTARACHQRGKVRRLIGRGRSCRPDVAA